MGQIAIWLDLAVVSMLWAAGCIARKAQPDATRRRLGAVGTAIVGVIFWGAVAGVLAFWESRVGGARTPLIASAAAGCASILAAIVIARIGRRRVAGEDGATVPAAARWSHGTLMWALVLTWLHVVFMFGLSDYGVRCEMDDLRAEARAIAWLASPPSIADSENAAVLYRRAWEQLDAANPSHPDWRKRVGEWLYPIEADFDPENPEMLAFVETHATQLALARDGGQRRGCSFRNSREPPSLDADTPWLNQTRGLARLLCLSARVNAHRGLTGAALDDLNACFALARHCTAAPALIGCLVAIAVEHSAFDSLQFVLDSGLPGVDDLAHLRISRIVDYSEAFGDSLCMEEAVFLNVFGGLTSSTSTARATGSVDPATPVSFSPYRVFLWRADVASYQRTMRTMQRLAARPIYESRRSWAELDASRLEGVITSILTPSFGRAADLAARADALHRLAIVAVEMLRYRHLRGVYPDTLDALVAGDSPPLAAIPVDPFTGDPLKLARTDDGRTIIYSLGPDLEDDGGTPPASRGDKDNDIVLVLPGGAGGR